MANIDFNSVNVGDELPPFAIELAQMNLWIYAGASGDFNLIHVDKEFAEKVGLGGTIAHGLSSMARASKVINDWTGDPGALKKLDVQMRGQAHVGDTVTFWAKVAAKDDATKQVTLDVGADNQDGTSILAKGTAVVQL